MLLTFIVWARLEEISLARFASGPLTVALASSHAPPGTQIVSAAYESWDLVSVLLASRRFPEF